MNLVTWLFGIGALVFGVGVSVYFTKFASAGLWIGFGGAVIVLLAIAIQFQQQLWESEAQIVEPSTTDIAIKQTRANVFVDTVTLLDDPQQNPRAKVVIKNSGQTPAYKVTHWTAIGVAEFPLKTNPPPPSRRLSVDILPASGTSENIVAMTRPINIDEKTVINMRIAALYVIGQIDYTDAFGSIRCTKYRHYIGGDVGFNGNQMAVAAEGNEADKDCDK